MFELELEQSVVRYKFFTKKKMLIKSIFIVVLAILIRGTLPRYRVDQLIGLNWKIFIFINIFFFNYLIILHLIF